MKLKWDLEHVYLYLVSFIALILIIVGAVNLTQTAIAYVTPVYEDYGPYSRTAPTENLAQWEEHFGSDFMEAEKARYEAITEENYQSQMLRQLVNGFAYVLIALPVYLYHWRKISLLEKED